METMWRLYVDYAEAVWRLCGGCMGTMRRLYGDYAEAVWGLCAKVSITPDLNKNMGSKIIRGRTAHRLEHHVVVRHHPVCRLLLLHIHARAHTHARARADARTRPHAHACLGAWLHGCVLMNTLCCSQSSRVMGMLKLKVICDIHIGRIHARIRAQY